MSVIASAPGKLVVLGEYAVLAGGPALVMAVDRRCSAAIAPSLDATCHLLSRTDTQQRTSFAPQQPSGTELVDLVIRHWPQQAAGVWSASLDSRALFGAHGKLGLGSSAAALTAWAGAWTAFAGGQTPGVTELIGLHRVWQAGAGSGLDVAASRLGGALCYRISEDSSADIVSVALPDSVGFVGVCSGRAASTGDLVERFNAWRERRPEEARAQLDRMRQIAEHGVAAARGNGVDEFLGAAASYAEALDALGRAIGTDLVTAEHRSIARVAARFGVTYKLSGAGGGDVGIALAADSEALGAFVAAVPSSFAVLKLGIDSVGLAVEVSTA